MSLPSGNNEYAHSRQKPPRRKWQAAESFWDFRASHCVGVLLTLALIFVGVAQFTVYRRQAKIMGTQTGIADRQARIAAAQAKIAQTELELSECAWVSASDIKIAGPLTYSNDGVSIPLIAYLRNTGHSPAHTVSVWPVAQSLIGDINMQKDITAACSQAEKISYSGVQIFPGDQNIPAMITAMIPSKYFHFEQHDLGVFIPRFVVCISYKHPVDGAFHHTWYTIQITMKKPIGTNGCCAIVRENGDIPADQLTLGLTVFNATGAD